VTPPHIQIIIGSIREGRVDEPVTRWFAELAAQREDLTSELVDLREWNLPSLTASRRWATKVAEAAEERARPRLRRVEPQAGLLRLLRRARRRNPSGRAAPRRRHRASAGAAALAGDHQPPWPQLHDGVFDGQQHARQAGALLDELV
jgi:hypothetical protein